SKSYRALIDELLRGQRTMVLDADGLNLLAAAKLRHTRPGAPLVMTPHPGEFARLAEAANMNFNLSDSTGRQETATTLARFHQAVVVLKGHNTAVTDGKSIFINETGNPALATAGIGDVLTGAIASLIAQGMSAFS